MTAETCKECGRLASDGKYCREHKPKPADKYADKDSDRSGGGKRKILGKLGASRKVRNSYDRYC